MKNKIKRFFKAILALYLGVGVFIIIMYLYNTGASTRTLIYYLALMIFNLWSVSALYKSGFFRD